MDNARSEFCVRRKSFHTTLLGSIEPYMSTWYTHSFQIHIYTYLPQSAFQIIQYGSRTFLKLEYNFHYFLLSKRFYFILLEAAFVLYTIYTHIITYTYISKKSFLYIFYIHVIYTIWYIPIHVIANISLCIKNYAKFFIYICIL